MPTYNFINGIRKNAFNVVAPMSISEKMEVDEDYRGMMEEELAKFEAVRNCLEFFKEENWRDLFWFLGRFY